MSVWNAYYTVSQKNCANLTMAITSSNLNRFVIFFTAAKSDKFPTKSILVYPPHLKYVAALPWETICTDTFLETLLTLQLTSGGSISRHVSVQMVGILNTFCEKNSCKEFAFSCVFGSSGICPCCQIFTVLILDGR